MCDVLDTFPIARYLKAERWSTWSIVAVCSVTRQGVPGSRPRGSWTGLSFWGIVGSTGACWCDVTLGCSHSGWGSHRGAVAPRGFQLSPFILSTLAFFWVLSSKPPHHPLPTLSRTLDFNMTHSCLCELGVGGERYVLTCLYESVTCVHACRCARAAAMSGQIMFMITVYFWYF